MKTKNKPKDHKSISKFLDTKETPKQRLAAFLQVDTSSHHSNPPPSTFIQQNYEVLIYLINDAFFQLTEKVRIKIAKNKNMRMVPPMDETDLNSIIIPALEKVLQYLPDKIHARWHYHHMIMIFRNLLHPKNMLEVRTKGIRLTILWLQGLQGNFNRKAQEVFEEILPDVVGNVNQEPNTVAIWPSVTPEMDATMVLFPRLLTQLTLNIRQMYWPLKEVDYEEDDISREERHAKDLRAKRIEGFKCVFNLCKSVYFSKLFGLDPMYWGVNNLSPLSLSKELREEGIEEAVLTVLKEKQNQSLHSKENVQLQVEVIKWFIYHISCIIKHPEKYCPYEKLENKSYMRDDEDYLAFVEKSEIIERVLFTDKDNTVLMNKVFQKGLLVMFKMKDEEALSHLKYVEEILIIYDDMIDQIRPESNIPEFLQTQKRVRRTKRFKDDQREDGMPKQRERKECFLQSIVLNVAPLLVYCSSKSDVRILKNKVCRVEKTVLGFYCKILKDIKPKNNTIYLIITCVLQSIEQAFNKDIVVSRYILQLDHLLFYVSYTVVKSGIQLPALLWNRIRKLFQLMSEDNHARMKWDDFMFEKVTPILADNIYKVDIIKLLNEEDRNKDKIIRGRLNDHGLSSDPGDDKDALSFLVEKYDKLRSLNWFQKRHKSDHDETSSRRKSKIKHMSSDQSSDDVFERQRQEHHHKAESPTDHEMREAQIDSSSEENISIAPTDGSYSVVLFRVFLTIRGNPNDFKSEDIHMKMFQSLGKITKLLMLIDDRQGLHDNLLARLKCTTDVPPVPVHHVLPWAFQAFTSKPSETYQGGKRESLKLICSTLIRHYPYKYPIELLYVFYKIILRSLPDACHRGTLAQEIIREPERLLLHEVVDGCHQIFSINLPGCMMVMPSLLQAARTVLDKVIPNVSTGPRTEALRLLGSLLSLKDVSDENRSDIIKTIADVGKSDSDSKHRSTALSMLGYIIITQLGEAEFSEPIQQPLSPTTTITSLSSFSTPTTPVRHASWSNSPNTPLRSLWTHSTKETTLGPDDPITTTRIVPQDIAVSSEALVNLTDIVLLQVKSRNESIAMTALSVIRDLQNWQSQLMQYDRQLPSRVLSILLGALHYHKDRLDKSEEVVSCGNHANQDTFSFNSSQFSAPTINSYISDIKGPKNNPVAGSTITTIVEWVITIPEEAKIDSFNTIIREVFKVLENISLDKPIFEKIGSCSIMAIDESLSKKYNVKEMSEEEHGQETMEEMCCSYQKIPDSEPISDLDYIKKLQTKIRRHAETALFFLSQYYQQFPLCGGPDYSNSMVFEYNPGKADSYHEKEVKLFNESEDLQMLIIDGRIITTSIELPIMDKDELPYNSSPGYGRTIVRNIVGRFCWSSKKVHSLHQSEHSKKMHSLNEQDKLPKLSKLTPLDFTDDIEIDSSTLVLKPVSASGPPRWFRRDCNDCNDLLHQV